MGSKSVGTRTKTEYRRCGRRRRIFDGFTYTAGRPCSKLLIDCSGSVLTARNLGNIGRLIFAWSSTPRGRLGPHFKTWVLYFTNIEVSFGEQDTNIRLNGLKTGEIITDA